LFHTAFKFISILAFYRIEIKNYYVSNHQLVSIQQMKEYSLLSVFRIKGFLQHLWDNGILPMLQKQFFLFHSIFRTLWPTDEVHLAKHTTDRELRKMSTS